MSKHFWTQKQDIGPIARSIFGMTSWSSAYRFAKAANAS